ncbi:hypothetical protein RND71_033542 [Anisodus tanguticus]|uniref:LOB domain-containing protein n=1 Tax=Anisodus tanguticus TaxID=243964 RepID=A0AAE1R8Z0_9SOLA|nr:hypothetical protein RND71_033542 [Anisodus tanguticus]
MFLLPELFYNNIVLLCCLVGGSSIMSNNNNNAEAETESHEVGSNRPACASCKHQRKKCVEGDCVMWRHFPANKMDEFLGVHKVFGISNVTKKIKSLDDVAQQDEAIKSFLWEARLWQEDPVHGPLGEYKKLEQQHKEEQRNKQQQIVELPDVPQLPPTITSEPIKYLPVDQNMVAPRENSANNSTHSDHQEDYNLVNSTVPNYTNLLQWHGGESQGTSNGHDLINVVGGNNRFGFGNYFPSHYNRPIEQMQNGFIPRPAGLQGIVHHPDTYNSDDTRHIQLHQQNVHITIWIRAKGLEEEEERNIVINM